MVSCSDVKEKFDNQFREIVNKEILQKQDFDPMFTFFRVHARELDLNCFKKFDILFTKYQQEYFSILEASEEDASYLEIRHSEIYNMHKERLIQFEYPRCSNSLYYLEDEFIYIVKRQIVNDATYYDLLEKLFYLKGVVDEKTLYIMHNILLYYQDVIKVEPTYILGLTDLEKMYSLFKKEECQKIKK